METDEGPASTSTVGTAARVRAVIADAGVSQREFARRVVMDPSKLSRALSGTRRFTVAELARIADEGGGASGWGGGGGARAGVGGGAG
ncbi:helix-turn-helix domain-containing protein, partial [Streptomyces albidoflavus]